MKVYLGASAGDRYRADVIRGLEELGHDVGLPEAEFRIDSVLKDVRDCDACVVLPRVAMSSAAAYVVAGIAHGIDKPLLVLSSDAKVARSLRGPRTGIFEGLGDLLLCLQELEGGRKSNQDA